MNRIYVCIEFLERDLIRIRRDGLENPSAEPALLQYNGPGSDDGVLCGDCSLVLWNGATLSGTLYRTRASGELMRVAYRS